MKVQGTIFAAACLALVGQALEASEHEVKTAFFSFIAKFGKSYGTLDHMQDRYDAFKVNYLKIEAHNALDAPFKLGVNEFTDMTEEQFVKERLSSGIRPPKKVSPERQARRLEAKKKLQSRVPLGPDGMPIIEDETIWADQDSDSYWDPYGAVPAYKNWFEEGMVTHPYDQHQCGSCWAFSAASTLESLAMIKGVDQSLQEYSVQQLMDCDTQNFVCDGGWMYEAYEYVKNNGINLKRDYRSYVANAASCDSESVRAKHHFKNTGMEEADGMTNDEMKRQIMVQPIGAAIFAPGILQSYDSGVVTEEFLHCSRDSYEVNHGIVVVGFGTVDQGHERIVHGHCNEYWIIRNSWGSNWGYKGTFKLCMDGAQSSQMPFGICHINEFGTWPTLDN